MTTSTLAPHITRYMAGRVAIGSYGPKSVRVVTPRLSSLARHFGARPLHHLTRPAIEAWLGDLTHLAVNSRAAYLASVRQLTAHLLDDGTLTADPCAGIPRLRRPRTVPRAQDPEAVRQVLDACTDDRERAIVWLMVGLGLRRMEVANLRWEHYDQRSGLMVIHGKAGNERVVPVPDQVAVALRSVRTANTGAIIRGHDTIDPISVEWIGYLVVRAMRRAGIKHAAYDGVSGHALRHTAASDVLDTCGDLRVVQQMLGHVNLSTTAIYLRRATAESMREAMAGRDYLPAA